MIGTKCNCFAYRDFPSSFLVAFKRKKYHISLEKWVGKDLEGLQDQSSIRYLNLLIKFISLLFRIINFNGIWVTKTKNRGTDSNTKKLPKQLYKMCNIFKSNVYLFCQTNLWSHSLGELQMNKVNTILVIILKFEKGKLNLKPNW